MGENANMIFFIILGLGLILLIKKRIRIPGIVLILISLTFIFIIPSIAFWKYKRNSVGKYSDKDGKEIIIYSNGKYETHFMGKTIAEGKVEYNNHEAFHFTLQGYSELISTHEDEIKNLKNDQTIFYRVK